MSNKEKNFEQSDLYKIISTHNHIHKDEFPMQLESIKKAIEEYNIVVVRHDDQGTILAVLNTSEEALKSLEDGTKDHGNVSISIHEKLSELSFGDCLALYDYFCTVHKNTVIEAVLKTCKDEASIDNNTTH